MFRAEHPLRSEALAGVADTENVGPLELGRRFRRLEAGGATQGQIARGAGVSRAFVCKRLKLLDLPRDVQALAEQEGLSFTRLYLLTELPSAGSQRRVARELLKRRWTTRELEDVVARELGRTPPRRPRTYRAGHPDALALAEALADSVASSLGRPVDVKPAARGRFEFRVTAADADDAIATAIAMGAQPNTSTL